MWFFRHGRSGVTVAWKQAWPAWTGLRHWEEFETELARTLEAYLPQDQAEQLADACARDEQAANDKVNQILDGSNLSIDRILDSAKQRKAEELARKYACRETDRAKPRSRRTARMLGPAPAQKQRRTAPARRETRIGTG